MAKQALNLVASHTLEVWKDKNSMPVKSTDGNKPQPEFISRAEASRMLRITPFSVERLVRSQQLSTWRVPGHSRGLISRAAVEQLAKQAAGMGGSV
jgi:hypothetical protein